MELCNGAQTRLGSVCQAGGAVTLRESFMNSARIVVLATGVFLGVQLASAQDLSRYRGYALDSSLESVIASSGARADRATTLHRRPATIQELEWRAPYSSAGSAAADSVRGIAFSFYNDALYQLIVSYDRDKTDGLTNKDLIESLSVTYGTPTPRSPGNRVGGSMGLADTIVLAQWGAFVLVPVDARTTRLIIRTRGEGAASVASLLLGPLNVFVFEPMHFIMQRQMLRGIKLRAEGRGQAESAP